MAVGVLLLVGAIIGHYITPNVLSQVDVITSPLQGNMICGLSKDIQTPQSQVTTPSTMNLLFHDNICATLSISKTILELSYLGGGFIGVGLAIFGGLTNEKRKNSLKRNAPIPD